MIDGFKLLLLSSGLLALSGCAAGRNVYYLWDAQRAFQEAELKEASTKAIYEYTLAREYLMKAREEAGYSDYRESEDLARKALEWSNKAAEIAEYGTSERELLLQEAEKNAPDLGEPAEKKAPTPTPTPGPWEE